MIKFSIITATYNVAKTFRQTAESVFKQTYPSVEYIVIDGGSTDGTVNILKEYSSRLAYWVSEPDLGIYDAFNKGIRAATGDYIYFLGADDCFFDEKTLSRVSGALNADIDVFSAAVCLVNEFCLEKVTGNELARNQEQYAGGMIPHQGMFVKADILKARPFDDSFRLAGDYDFFLFCYFNEKISFQYEDFPVAYYATGGFGSSNTDLSLEEHLRIWRKYHMVQLLKKYENGFNPNRFRAAIRACIDSMGVYPWYLRLFQGWRPHHCDNKICRWCGREG